MTDSHILRNVEEKLCGILVLCSDNQACEFLWAHSTPSLCIGYMNSSDSKAQVNASIILKFRIICILLSVINWNFVTVIVE